jgi:hypothetical protein
MQDSDKTSKRPKADYRTAPSYSTAPCTHALALDLLASQANPEGLCVEWVLERAQTVERHAS